MKYNTELKWIKNVNFLENVPSARPRVNDNAHHFGSYFLSNILREIQRCYLSKGLESWFGG